MENKAIDIFPKAIAILSSLLVFLGVIASVVYYRSFNINILEYITLGESLVLFISKFSSLCVSAIFGFLLSKLFLEPAQKESDIEDSFDAPYQEITIRQKLHVFFVILPLFLLSINGFSPLVLWSLPVALAVRSYVLYYILKRLRIVLKYREIDYKIFQYIQSAGISLVILASVSMTEAYMVHSGNKNKIVTLYCSKGGITQTNSNIIYLGKSELYYYLYNKSEKKAVIIKTELVDRMEISSFKD